MSRRQGPPDAGPCVSTILSDQWTVTVTMIDTNFGDNVKISLAYQIDPIKDETARGRCAAEIQICHLFAVINRLAEE